MLVSLNHTPKHKIKNMSKALLYLFLNLSNRLSMIFGNRTRRLAHVQGAAAISSGNEIDDAVITAFSQGNEVAFKQIYDHYAPAIYRVVSRYFQSPALAEELLQELFSECWLKRELYHGAAQLRLRLFTRTRDLAIKHTGKMIAEALAGRRVGEKQQKATLEILPAKETASRQNISCNIDLEALATSSIAVWRRHNADAVL
jgi:hypothetical protein